MSVRVKEVTQHDRGSEGERILKNRMWAPQITDNITDHVNWWEFLRKHPLKGGSFLKKKLKVGVFKLSQLKGVYS